MPRASPRPVRNARSPIRKPRRTRREDPKLRSDLIHKLANKALVQPLQDSDDSDKLVVKGPGSRTGGFLRKQEIYMSGAIVTGDKPGSHPTRAQRRKQMMQAAQTPRKSEPAQSALSKPMRPDKSQGTTTKNTEVLAPSSTVRPGASHPTPSRENSILDGIRHRKRQPSILRSPQADHSTLRLTDDSFALPDDESTPLNVPKAKSISSTPIVPKLSTSASRKRKIEYSEPAGLVDQAKPMPSSEPTLPPQPLSFLRASGQKQRPHTEQDNDSVLAPPMSSSSTPSPARSRTHSSIKFRNATQPPPALRTSQLQALMPTKRRKTARNRKTPQPEFDIPEDSDSPKTIPEVEQDSSFLPARRKAKQPRALGKGKNDVGSAASMSKQSKSKAKTPLAQSKSRVKSRSNKSTRLTPSQSRSAEAQGTKSPSQQSSTGRGRALSSEANGGKETASSNKAKRSGGFPDKVLAAIEEKENLGDGGEMSEVLVSRSDDDAERRGHPLQTKAAPLKKARSKWDDIDDWDMEFEEVDLWERSSEKDAR